MSILVGFFAAQKLIRFQVPIYFTSELDYFHWQLFPPEESGSTAKNMKEMNLQLYG